ncbi:MAG: hypothetical protein LBS59_03815 [Puniceicoccales bacterium]|jgi:hypothetical protein|nr:hypothetical protein [Puniceicoccales bacterium]
MKTKTDILAVIKKLNESVEYIEPTFKNDEFYFEFPAGVFWSISHWELEGEDGQAAYALYLYPLHKGSFEDLLRYAHLNTKKDGSYTAFSSLYYPELFEQLRFLYEAMHEKYFGINGLLERVLQIKSPQDEKAKIIEKQKREAEIKRIKTEEGPF